MRLERRKGATSPACYIVPVHNSRANTPKEGYATLLGEAMFTGLDGLATDREFSRPSDG